jgi:uncharacterized protein (DUF433 family)
MKVTMANEHTRYQERIVVDPEILVGKPVVRGTRIPVELILKRLAQDLNFDTLFESYPRLTPEDVKACLEYAKALVEGEALFPAPASLS